MGKDIGAALVTTVLSITFGLSTSALIFSGALQPYFGMGVIAALISSVLLGSITACFSSFRIAISTPSTTIAVALAATTASLEPTVEHLPGADAATLAFMVLALTTLAVGGTMLALGQARLANLGRFVPFPVVSSFFAASGWLMMLGGLRLATQVSPTLASWREFTEPIKVMDLAMVIACAASLATVTQRSKNPILIPGIMISGVLLVNLALALAHVPRDGTLAHELMFQVTAQPGNGIATFTHVPNYMAGLHLAPLLLSLLPHLLPNILVVILISVLTGLFTFSGLENALDHDGELDHELSVQGAANLVAGLAGGFAGMIGIGSTLAARAAGGHGRWIGIFTSVLCLGTLLIGVSLVNVIPRFLIGGLLLQLGLTSVWNACIASRQKMPFLEWALVVGTVLIAVWFGFVPAIASGIIGGCFIFAADISKIAVVRRIYGINERASPLVRSGDEITVLARDGGCVKVVELSGFIFFGSAFQMQRRVAQLIKAGGLHMLILDFGSVSGCDSSATTVLARLGRLLKGAGITQVLAAVPPDVLALLRSSGVLATDTLVLEDRNSALEHAEAAVLARARTPAPSSIPMTDWLAASLGSTRHAHALVPLLECADLAAGAYICRQDEPTDTLLFIESGRVGVMISTDAGEVCIRIFGPHTIAGEQGFILDQPRSASLKVEADARIWTLHRAAYEDLKASNAALVIALMGNIVRVQSERLTFATRQIAALA